MCSWSSTTSASALLGVAPALLPLTLFQRLSYALDYVMEIQSSMLVAALATCWSRQTSRCAHFPSQQSRR